MTKPTGPAPSEAGLPRTGTPQFPESAEEKAKRLARTIQRMVGVDGSLEGIGSALPAVAVLEQRIAGRLATADPKAELPDAMKKTMARETARDGLATAAKLALGEARIDDLDEIAIANLEAVIRVTGRPAWFVRKDVPASEINEASRRADEFWIVQIGNAGKNLRKICARTGVVTQVEDGSPIPFGTAWMIGARTVITNAHVAVNIAYQKTGLPPGDSRDRWRMRPNVKCVINFAFENKVDRSAPFEVEDVLYVQTSGVPDLAIFRLRDTGAAPPAPITLDLAQRASWRDADVFAAGHPIRDLQGDPNVAIVFGPLDGTKRFSPGKLLGVLGSTVLAHDCSTTNGSSGSPIVDFASLKAVGLHYYGAPGARNESVCLAAYAEHPAIVKSLSGAWD